jgi:uncharacterized protein with HEPN domain
MAKPRDIDRLHHMLEAAGKAIKLTAGKNSLDNEEVLTLAILRLLEIIGEAASCVSSECRRRHTEIPWLIIQGTRNRLIHGYYDYDVAVVWRTVQDDLSPLVNQLRTAIVGETERNQSDRPGK